MKALTEKFARCELNVSKPLVSFRETVLSCDGSFKHQLPPPWSEELAKNTSATGGRANFTLPIHSGEFIDSLSVSLRCSQLPMNCLPALTALEIGTGNETSQQKFSDYIFQYHKSCQERSFATSTTSEDSCLSAIQTTVMEENWSSKFDNAWRTLVHSFFAEEFNPENGEIQSQSLLRRILSVGSRNIGTNLLLLDSDCFISIHDGDVQKAVILLKERPYLFWKVWYRIHSSIVAGFELCASSGPLMQEPLHGVCFSVEGSKIPLSVCHGIFDQQELENLFLTVAGKEGKITSGISSMVSGQLISETRDCLRVAMLSAPLRVVEPIYDCNLQCEQSQLGNLYSVLAKRRGEVYKEDIIEGTTLFVLSAHLAVSESFGFAQELLKKTSGSGTTPQLKFSHWAVIEEDPFWRPVTEEELEEFGETASAEHKLPRVLIDQVRKRKGLPIEEKVVVCAEKQRTLNKKK